MPMELRPEDEPALIDYFDASPDDTIWLRTAWFEGGARFVALRRDRRIVAVAAHDRNGVVQVHAAEGLPEVAHACLRSRAAVAGVAGAPEQVAAALVALDLGSRQIVRTSHEILMALDLDVLVVPELLSNPGVVSRRARTEDLPLLVEWRIGYFREVHAITPDEQALAEVREHQDKGRLWVLEVDGVVVNTACFSAVFPRLVQIEYAYSPAELRSKKYGRSAVAGALVVARGEGVRRAVFNTDRGNLAVQIGIHPVGFRKTGDYEVVIFAPTLLHPP